MTKELRKKFILINMALVGTVLLIVFAVLCFQNYQRLEQDSMRVMERYFNDNGARPVPELEFDKKREWRNFPLMLSFCAVVDSNGELVSYQSDNLTVSEATVSQAVEAALDKMESSGKNSGTLSGLDLRYLARGQQGQMWIAFVDRTQEYASMRSFLTSALQLGAAGLIARLADGALRDALSILDTCAGVTNQIDETVVRQMAGVTDRSYLFRMSDALAARDAASALAELAALRQQSVDIIFTTYSGLRVSSDALRYEQNVPGVYVLDKTTIRFKPVEIIKDNGNFLLCEPRTGTDDSHTLSRLDLVIIESGGIELKDGALLDEDTVKGVESSNAGT